LAEAKIWIFSILGATNCFSKSVDIVLLSLLRLLLLLDLLAAHLHQLLYFKLLPTGLSALRFSSSMAPVCTFSPGIPQKCFNPLCRTFLCIPFLCSLSLLHFVSCLHLFMGFHLFLLSVDVGLLSYLFLLCSSSTSHFSFR